VRAAYAEGVSGARARLGIAAMLAGAAACAMPDFAVDDREAGDGANAIDGGDAPETARDASDDDDAPLSGDVFAPRDAGIPFDGNVDAFAVAACASDDAGSFHAAYVDGRVHCYFRNVANGPWTNSACQPPVGYVGGHLATITSSAERDVIHAFYPTLKGGDWIGLHTDPPGSTEPSAYRWVTGESVAGYDGWAHQDGQPNGAGAGVYWDFTGLATDPKRGQEWYEDSLGAIRNYLCEREFDVP